MKRIQHIAIAATIAISTITWTLLEPVTPAAAAATKDPEVAEPARPVLSPLWKKTIQQWAPQIAAVADNFGLDPDFVAAVIREESNGDPKVISRVGAVGLMGVMPTGPGLEWRPSAEDLADPTTNLSWGVAILSEVIRQSGGDLYSALAAYSGGWDHASSRVPRNYAASVLDYYGKAVMARNGLSPDIATQWTLAIELRGGHVPHEPLLILGDQPVSGLVTFGEHLIYDYIDQSGKSYRVKGYVVPVALLVPLETGGATFGDPDHLEAELQSRLGNTIIKVATSNPNILLACLPSLSRLRGHASTRWFAPSSCPSWHR